MATYGYNSWFNHNKDVINKSLQIFVKEKESEIVIRLIEVADTVLTYIENERDKAIPVWTGNLHDATGIAVYANGRMVYMAIPMKRAKKMQSTGVRLGARRYIDGHEFLRLSISEGARYFSTGIWIVLYSAVPYASRIDAQGSPIGRGKDFFKLTRKELTNAIFSKLTRVVYGFNV